jgi:hypothetical protein
MVAGGVNMRGWVGAVLGLLSAFAQAAPQQVDLVYGLYRDGIKLGQVSDRFVRSGSRYVLVSETHASGTLKLLLPGVIRLESSGAVTRQGLRPDQFQHARSDAPHKLATVKFDWKRRGLGYRYKGESWRVPGLRDGAQDQLSQLYQFMLAPAVPDALELQVTSGRRLSVYRYARSDGGAIETPLGTLATVRMQRITAHPDDKAITVWLAPTRNNLPVKIRVTDEGITLEQRLISAAIKD